MAPDVGGVALGGGGGLGGGRADGGAGGQRHGFGHSSVMVVTSVMVRPWCTC